MAERTSPRRRRGRIGRAARFLFIVGGTASTVVIAFFLITARIHANDLDPSDVEIQIQLGLQRQLDQREPEASPLVRDVSCMQRAEGHDLRCIARVRESGSTTSVPVDVIAGQGGKFIWQVG